MENVMRIKWLEEVDSTNNELLRHVGDYANLSVVAAVTQTAGRGQRGNRWVSAPGDNLTFSFILKPEGLPAREVMAVTCLATLAVRDALREEGVPAVIKWPNDIYVGVRKICGMLVENGLDGPDIAWSVVGIGINLNQTEFPGGVQNPTSLKRLTGMDYDPAAFLEKLCHGIEALLPALNDREGRDGLRASYERDLFRKDSPAPYRDLTTGQEFTGLIRGITPEGLLRIEKAEGPEKTFGFKEISYIL
jgi:BirA family biotin operon repressor/biotin-[acetyl-CoA-carboxylase] ligase